MTPPQPRYSRVVVLAPSATSTGGPELLHQLVHEIRLQGGEALIHYLPDPAAEVPERYRCYDTPVLNELGLDAGDCVVVPETMVPALPLRSKARHIVWWLSFDFFESRREPPFLRALANAYRRSLLKVQTLLGALHLFQSHYARSRLKEWGMDGAMLSDYLSLSPPAPDAAPRRDVILYNPKKGIEITNRLRESCPHLTFQPIQNMTKAEVEQAFAQAKLYIDFGEHPGKDRLPREAAMMGTVVVVGIRGSAAFDEDVGLAPLYKLPIDADLPEAFAHLVDDIFGDFARHQQAQAPYRNVIAKERQVFAEEVRAVFFQPAGAGASS
ncbi:hypothetical protein [Terrihabitans sp. B22-R8]|uniref:hypothetical protein n=1 Tax=Terrihabitans sp. B22-R8 TaxID=3425128 RepID=UPI00403C1C48